MKDRRLEAFGRLLDVMDELRVKCPWDREQTFESLRNNTIEETFELADAIADNDLDEIRKELGDLLLHVVFYSKIGSELGAFDIADVAHGECDKLIYRHPHVFGDVDAESAGEVIRNWEDLKTREKGRKKGILSGVPRSLPAMVKAYRISEKAAAAGFDWDQAQDVWEKVKEEIEEVEAEVASGDRGSLESEFGDVLFALVNAARLYGIDPEMALERSNKKFISRFNHIESAADASGREFRSLSMDEMEQLWQEAKTKE